MTPTTKLEVNGTVKATGFSGDGSGLTGLPGVAAWSSTAATTLSAAANSGYILTGATPATVVLPTNAAIGNVVRVTAQGAGGYTINAGSGQAIVGGNSYTFVPHDSSRSWVSVTSSADGSKLAAVVNSGQIYTSGDSGATWIPHESNRLWTSITSSAEVSNWRRWLKEVRFIPPAIAAEPGPPMTA